LENLGPLSFKFHHNMIDPLHAIPSSLFLWTLWQEILKTKK
jgi:hypothetical protein